MDTVLAYSLLANLAQFLIIITMIRSWANHQSTIIQQAPQNYASDMQTSGNSSAGWAIMLGVALTVLIFWLLNQ